MYLSSKPRLRSAAVWTCILTGVSSCSDDRTGPSSAGGAGSNSSLAGANGAQSGAGAAGTSSANGGAAGANAGAGVGGSTAGNGNGGSAGSVAGGAGAGGSGSLSSFVPCSTAPAATPPALKRGPAINGFPGMQTAGQIVGVPGEPGLLYVIGHRDGNVFTVQNGEVVGTPLVKVAVADGGNNEQGLLSMALHPGFADNRLFYLFYNAESEDMTIDEFERTSPTAAVFKRNVYSEPRDGACCFHNGGSITFNPKDASNSLFFSVGNMQGNNAGDPEGTAGRVLRIDPATGMYSTYVYGLRNPYRMTIDRLTGDMFIADVANGPGGTIIFNANGVSGTDFGYRNNNGSPDVNDGILRDNAGAAIIGGYVYRGNKIPGLCGRYFYGNHDGGTVKSVVVAGGVKVGDTVSHGSLAVPGNITSFGEDGEGELYMASLNNNAIYKIEAE